MRRVVIVAFEGVQPLDVVGPAEVFNTAARIRPPGYSVEVVAPGAGPIRATSVQLMPDRAIASCRGPIDTLICAGGTGVREAAGDERLVRWIASAAKRSRRTASVCTGAFLLAQAGLLDGKRATTHWSACAALARRHPETKVEPDPIFVEDDGVYTSAGVTAGMDLALALVDEDEGRDVSLEVARWLVLFLRRPGGQSQFSAQLAAQTAEREPLKELQSWIPDNLDADLSVPALARKVSMSERNFARAFRREVGMTPAAYVETSRVERARIALESGGEQVELVARRTGFGTVETMRRAFRRRLGVSPSDYRDRFNAEEAA
ncbi:MAG TPA: GlxA family transcriptional regulator [Thermoleophilaceae bacterium]|jgi:transcriptional regulator GlxA family with amidase domain